MSHSVTEPDICQVFWPFISPEFSVTLSLIYASSLCDYGYASNVMRYVMKIMSLLRNTSPQTRMDAILLHVMLFWHIEYNLG